MASLKKQEAKPTRGPAGRPQKTALHPGSQRSWCVAAVRRLLYGSTRPYDINGNLEACRAPWRGNFCRTLGFGFCPAYLRVSPQSLPQLRPSFLRGPHCLLLLDADTCAVI